MDKTLTKLSRRQQRFSKIFMEHGEDAIDYIFDTVYYKVCKYRQIVKTDKTFIPKLRHYTHLYEALLMCGVYALEEQHKSFLSSLKRIIRCSNHDMKGDVQMRRKKDLP
jgi:hypothetical protein